MYFPVITSIQVIGYEMYPGPEKDEVLNQPTDAPLTVIMGANGLGKSTLLLLAFRLLTGPSDIPGTTERRDLGSAKLAVTNLRDVSTFARRVNDRAQEAFATLHFKVGPQTFSISRSLKNLRLVGWTKDDEVGAFDEGALQKALFEGARLSSFADWILMLRFVTFYLDDRQVLFWDNAAQTTLLRSLFLSPEQASEWLSLERVALSADSAHRNLRTVVNSQRRETSKKIPPKDASVASLREEYRRLAALEAEAAADLENAVDVRRFAEDERAKINVARLHAQRAREEKGLAYERLKILDLASRFPTSADSALLVWTELLSESHCLVCNHEVPELRELIAERIRERQCAVCGSEVEQYSEEGPVTISDAQVRVAWEELTQSQIDLEQLDRAYGEANEEQRARDQQVNEIELAMADRQARLTAIRTMLPSDNEEFAAEQNELARLEARLAALERELEAAVERFEAFVNITIESIVSKADAVRAAFGKYSSNFLLGRGDLTWQPRSQQIGQSRFNVLVPSYELRLGGADGDGKSVRNNAADVSESQKEFIDLAFRMALIETAGEDGATICVDTPESSLDAVYSKRAAEVLASYCSRGNGHNMIVASNLTDGQLIPAMVREIREQKLPVELVNLIELGRPTAAINEMRQDYDDAYQRFLEDLGDS